MRHPANPLRKPSPRPRRIPGQVYTPGPMAQFLAQVALQHLPTHRPLTLLDPACGEGALLTACREVFTSTNPNEPPLHLVGVETDSNALAHAQSCLPQATLICGDALTGPAWTDPPSPDWITTGLSWAITLPDIAAAGGFDLVIANPPFIRERSAKPLFDAVASTPLGQAFREPRMDYWFYFFHRSLDLLRPGGSLTFIVPSYFVSSTGARHLRQRLEADTDLLDLIDLDAAPVFPGVAGQHLIFRARKRGQTSPGEPQSPPDVRLTFPCDDHALSTLAPEQIARELSACHLRDRSPMPLEPRWTTQQLPASNLFASGRLLLRPPAVILPSAKPVRLSDQPASAGSTLGDFFEVRQGIAENPPRLIARHVREFPDLGPAGTGVFVLSDAEVEALELSAAERTLLRPYYEARSVRRFTLLGEPAGQLLYLRRETCADLTACPALERHLLRYRPLLDRRREVLKGTIAWWHLHWPREERLFIQPRILALQMGKEPRFALIDAHPTFVNFSVNLICPRAEAATNLAKPSLATATGLLNSRFAATWFKTHAKRRGIALEINGHLLKRFPWPDCPSALLLELADLVQQRRQAREPETLALETAIDELVDRAYQNHPASE
jgi:adenine-specific DNA-methyltransferase